jgi:hypothetical protein
MANILIMTEVDKVVSVPLAVAVAVACTLFNGTCSSSYYVASNARMIRE